MTYTLITWTVDSLGHCNSQHYRQQGFSSIEEALAWKNMLTSKHGYRICHQIVEISNG